MVEYFLGWSDMALLRRTVYGPDGFDPAKPNSNVIDTADVPIPAEQENADTLRARATAALAANANYLAIATPSNLQVAGQVRTLTKECNALIRLLLGLLADVSDTA